MHIDLDTSQQTEQSKLEQAEEIQLEQVIENVNNQAKALQEDGIVVNKALAEEVLSVLQEIEQFNSDSADGHKYINWETESIPYRVLRRAGESEPARMIKNKRRLDFAQYGRPTKDTGSKRGARLVFCNSDYQPTKEEKTALKQWEQKIIDKLFYASNDSSPNFGKFIGNAYEDFFDLDDITIEIRADGFNRPVAVHLQDPIIWKPVIKPRKYDNHDLYDDDITELITDFSNYLKEPIQKEQEIPDYLLVYNNRKFASATRDRVRKFHFFTRSDFRKAQRGYGVIEQGTRMLTHILNSLNYNASNFTNNKLPQGFFLFSGGGVGNLQLQKLKKIFSAYQNGVGGANRFPMISLTGEKADAKWVGVKGNSKDMEYHQFMTLLFSIFCQLSGTDPRELALGSYGDTVSKPTLFDESSDGLVKESRDIGAKTFLMHLADSLNSVDSKGKNIFQHLTGFDCKIEFTGFEVEDKKGKQELISKELQSTKSINDLLAQEDEEAQEFKLGDINIYDIKGLQNPQIFQALLFKAQSDAQEKASQQQQEQQQAQAQQEPPQEGEQSPQGQEEVPQQGAEGTQGTESEGVQAQTQTETQNTQSEPQEQQPQQGEQEQKEPPLSEADFKLLKENEEHLTDDQKELLRQYEQQYINN